MNTSDGDIYDIIISSESSDTHGWDNISIKLLKLSGKSLVEPLEVIYEVPWAKKTFLGDQKKGNIILIQRKSQNNIRYAW